MPRHIEPWELDRVRREGHLNYAVRHEPGDDRLTLIVQHDSGAVDGFSGTFSTGVTMPAEWWAVVLPALVARMPANVAQECLKRITERAGEVL